MFQMKEGFALELLERLRLQQSTTQEIRAELVPYGVRLDNDSELWGWLLENGHSLCEAGDTP